MLLEIQSTSVKRIVPALKSIAIFLCISFFDFTMAAPFILIGPDGKPYVSDTKGVLGGHQRLKIYGRLDCPSALRWLKKGKYRAHRVFFASESDARAAGYRPCAVCMREEYELWKRK